MKEEKKDFLIKKEYELVCLSPVHIGSGEELEQSEYIYDEKTQRVGFLDEGLWRKFLATQQLAAAGEDDLSDWQRRLKKIGGGGTLLDELAEAAAQKGCIGNLLKWLIAKGVKREQVLPLVKSWAQAEPDNYKRLNPRTHSYQKENLNRIARHAVTADGQLYIPGSSLKGAFRTAIIRSMLIENKELQRTMADKLAQLISPSRSIKKDLGRLADELENKILAKLRLEFDGKKVSNQLKDTLRGLRVSDAYLVEPVKAVIVQHTDGLVGGGENTISLFRECLPAGARLRFTVTIEKAMLKEIGIEDFEGIIANMESLLAANCTLLKRAFINRPDLLAEMGKATLQLGGGTGFLSKSLWYSLFEENNSSQEEARRLLAKYFDFSYQVYDPRLHRKRAAHNHQVKDKVLSPRTLKIAKSNGKTQIMGLCRIDEVTE